MNEQEIIRTIIERFPRNPAQHGKPFTCDAEIIPIADQLWGLTIDEFTPEEDRFTDENPFALGANLATATLSDLLAAGAEPAWFMQALSLPRGCDEDFIAKLSSGIAQALEEADCYLCGGDIGTADSWRFCGFAMGRIPDNRPLTHTLPCEPQTLWVTGELGDANMAAFTGQPTPRFELRMDAAGLLRKYAAACIDTSGGFFDALWLLHNVNEGLELAVDLAKVPLAPVVSTANLLGIPAEAALLGGAGEYELLFSTPADIGISVCDQLRSAGATPIGSVSPSDSGGIAIYRNGDLVSRMPEAPPCPRGAASIEEYIGQVIEMARRLCGDNS